ncbi:MAG: DUF2399 domain-containing protein [Acidimicrobiales bacterium]
MGATTWRMRVTDSESAVATARRVLPELAGSPVSVHWDLDLEQAMLRAGRAVPEEFVLGTLVQDLALRPARAERDCLAGSLGCLARRAPDDGAAGRDHRPGGL